MKSENISSAVQQLYDTYPFPPEPLLDSPPPGYNWRWNWQTAYNFCTGQTPEKQNVRILDAGCGTGVGTEYLVHLNPAATVVGIDLSATAMAVAKERCRRSGATRVEFRHLSLYDCAQLPGEFDLINCVGVLHHLPDPIRGIQSLAAKLAPGGLMHIFVYGELGRWEIQLMQKAIALLQGDKLGDYSDGVQLGRQLFATLSETNRLVKREKERWSLENYRDECFADMYVHPQEIDYNIETLFELIDASGLDFLGFSNPDFWRLERLLKSAPNLMERAAGLSDASGGLRQRAVYRLIELLDPEVTHYEFFLGRSPLPKADWTSDRALLNAIPHISPCLSGWPSQQFFNQDYKLVNLSTPEFQFMQACEANLSQQTVEEILAQSSQRGAAYEDGRTMASVNLDLDGVRNLQSQQLILLTPKKTE